MDELKDNGFRQRVFTTRKRAGRAELVGANPDSIYKLHGWFESSPTGGAARSRTPTETRLLNGERLDLPCAAELGEEHLPVDPIDVSIAMTSGQVNRNTSEESWPDPRPAGRRGYPLDATESAEMRARVQAEYDRKAAATNNYTGIGRSSRPIEKTAARR